MTAIEWTDETINPIRARNKATGQVGWWCAHLSPGCVNCYAENMNMWRGNLVPFKAQHQDEVEIFLDEKTLAKPLAWPKGKRIFVADMTDLFGAWVKTEWIHKVVDIAEKRPDHTLQLLTKRSNRMLDYVQAIMEQGGSIPTNIWWGISVENQDFADERRDHLAKISGYGLTTYVSYEPALGPVDWKGWEFLDWMIIGGESGKKARPFANAWAADSIAFCQANGVAPFMKQTGSQPTTGPRRKDKGGLMEHWPPALRVREFPA